MSNNKQLLIGLIILGLVIFSTLIVFTPYKESVTQENNGRAVVACEHFYDPVEYNGGDYGRCLHGQGYKCDYGYSEKRGGCCDEDDYSCELCTANRYDCSDFRNLEDAQDIYEMCRDFQDGIPDVHQLDRDGDGIACESM